VPTTLIPSRRVYPGSEVRLTCDFDVNDVATDPTTVSLIVRKPSGTEATYTYAGGTITKSAVGRYYKDLAIDIDGLWTFRWVSTGTAAGADEGEIQVRRSEFA
jgi:hypothetical protein